MEKYLRLGNQALTSIKQNLRTHLCAAFFSFIIIIIGFLIATIVLLLLMSILLF